MKTKPQNKIKKMDSFSIRGLKGFRKRDSGKIEAHKMVDGKRYWELFDRESDAYHWKKNFHPILNPTPTKKIKAKNALSLHELRKELAVEDKMNGRNSTVTFSDVWALYWNTHLSTKEVHTQHNNQKVAKFFYGPLLSLKMCTINRNVIGRILAEKKREVTHSQERRVQRCNFDNELKKLSTLFNWYKKNFDPSFENPVCDFHKTEGFIRHRPKRKKKMSACELVQFLDAIESGRNGEFWRDMAEAQLFLSARIGEIGGLTWRAVNFNEKIIEISTVAVYLGKEFHSLKPYTKNGESRVVAMNSRLEEIFKRRYQDKDLNQDTQLVFHLNGQAPSKQRIDTHYNRAFKRASLPYRGTHCLRHTMANLTRSHLSLDHAKALGGWKSSKVVELIYTDTPTHLGKESVDCIEKVLSETRLNLVK